LPQLLEQADCSRRGDVQRLGALGERDRNGCVAGGDDLLGQALALGAQDERRPRPQVDAVQRLAAVDDQGDAPPLGVLEAADRDAEDRAGGSAQRLRPCA